MERGMYSDVVNALSGLVGFNCRMFAEGLRDLEGACKCFEAILLTLIDLEIANRVESYLALGGNGAIEDIVANLNQSEGAENES